jgi:OmpA-OmpF porin, OOP family
MTHSKLTLSLAALVLGSALAACSSPPPPAPPPQAPPPPPPVVAPPPPPQPDLALMGAQLDIKTDIEFDVGKSDIKDSPLSRQTLGAVLEIMKKAPITKLRIEGHTDSDGNAADNQKLSEARARSVGAWLSAHGVEPGRFDYAGCAARDPIVPNDSAEHKQRNRRTEFDVDSIAGKRVDGFTEPCAPNKFRK